MRFSLVFLLVLLASASAQDADRLAPLLDGMGDHSRPADTDDALAQRYADQGLVLSFAFNHAEAVRAFQEAQRLDPSCAMCAWGEALARGPHVNAPMNADDVAPAWAALQRAHAGADRLGPADRALVEALSARYTPDLRDDRSALDRAYADAMREAAARFPADADVQALFAEALMDTMPWDYWNPDGSPKPETEEVLAALDRALGADPDHPLALHLQIHAVEKQRPELGVEAAERLGPLVPSAGHLVHMPGHIWMRVGRYHDAVVANQRAVLADDDYLAQCHAQGLYPLGYVPHNHHFLWVAAMMGGERATALASADHMGRHTEHMSMPGMEFVQHFAMSPLYARAAFEDWDAILATPAPDDLVYPTAVWHVARGLAFARTGRPDPAQRELDALRPLAADTSLGAQFGGLNTLGAILGIAVPYLTGEVAAARGDTDEAVRQLTEAVRLEDALTYDEPPPWALPSRWALGRVLLDAGRAREAEAVYRADLAVYPENGRGLAGLERALLAQGKADQAQPLEARIRSAWRWADVPLAARLGPRARERAASARSLDPAVGDTVAVNGIQMYVETMGDGPPLVLLHAFGGCAQSWRPHVEALARHYRLILPDLRGHGRSTSDSAPFTHRQAARDVFALLDQLGIDRVKAMGMSSGGMTLLHMATQQPDRVDAMVLIGATSHFPEQARAIMRQTVADSLSATELAEWGACSVRGEDQTREVIERFHQMKDSYDDMTFTAPWLSTIHASTLLVHGDRDAFFPVRIPVAMYESIPDASLWIVPGGEHLPIFGDHAEAFQARALTFLNQP